jgi:TetR/AcrR family transcriptional repressor of bet genes
LRNTTLDTVAERAKVSRSLVVFHFKSKNKMHIDLLNYLGAQFGAGWDAVLANGHGTPGERLLKLLEFDVGFASQHPKFLAVWFAFWGQAKGSTLYHEVGFPRDRRYKQDVRDLLQELVKAGANDHVDVPALNKGIEAMLFGLWLDAHLHPSPDHHAVGMRAIKAYLSTLFPGQFTTD